MYYNKKINMNKLWW